ncbi:hypothetical protein [Tardiphaga alba]|uniref:hypothetical protein n=1 Tax=Tardiphaga alba TaxID=340268 RepID=UPI002012A996|nr:hypothetical protein [Tardiphaga alba]
MRITISKWAAAFAVAAVSVAASPAMAGGGYYSGGCSPCGGYNYYGTGYGYAGYQTLADPTPVTRQYYYVNQGPTYSGPGQFAPVPTYQETAIGWRGYPRYDGGPYANPYNHYSYGTGYAPAVSGPVVFTPRLNNYSRPSYRYGYGMRPRAHYGHAYRSHVSHRYTQPRVIYGSRHYGPRGYGQHHGYAPRQGYAPRHGYTQRQSYHHQYQQRPQRRVH